MLINSYFITYRIDLSILHNDLCLDVFTTSRILCVRLKHVLFVNVWLKTVIYSDYDYIFPVRVDPTSKRYLLQRSKQVFMQISFKLFSEKNKKKIEVAAIPQKCAMEL